MPVHFLAEWVSSRVPSEYYASIAAALVATSFLKTWSAGPKLLDIEEAAPDPEPSPSSSSSSSAARNGKDGGKAQRNDSALAAAGPSTLRDLHGRVVLVASGAFSSLGVVTLSSLAHRGAQIIALTPDLRSPRVLQLVSLLRSSTNNELIYAEKCDLADLDSVSRFAAKWNQGDPTTLGPSGGGKGGPRRIDILLFLPSEETIYSFGQDVRPSARHPRYERAYVQEVLARFHLVNALLPSLLLLPPERDIRIISTISPWYGAGAHSFDAIVEDPSSKSYLLSGFEPWRIHGATSLRWFALMRELQRRLHLLAEADARPRDKLPGIDPSAATAASSRPRPVDGSAARMGTRRSNISTICITTGFERNNDILAFLLPSRQSSETGLYPDDDDGEGEGEGDGENDDGMGEDGTERGEDATASGADPRAKLSAAIDPRRRATGSVGGGGGGSGSGVSSTFTPDTTRRRRRDAKTEASLATLHNLPSATSSSSSSSSSLVDTITTMLVQARHVLRYIFVLTLWPLIWLLTQSPATASNSLVWASVKRVESDADFLHRISSPSHPDAPPSRVRDRGGQENVSKKQATRHSIRRPLMGGELYRAGRIVRPTLPAWLLEDGGAGFAKLWDDEEKRVEELVRGAIRRPGGGDGADPKAEKGDTRNRD